MPARITDGDAVEVEVEGIGALSNTVRLEKQRFFAWDEFRRLAAKVIS